MWGAVGLTKGGMLEHGCERLMGGLGEMFLSVHKGSTYGYQVPCHGTEIYNTCIEYKNGIYWYRLYLFLLLPHFHHSIADPSHPNKKASSFALRTNEGVEKLL